MLPRHVCAFARLTARALSRFAVPCAGLAVITAATAQPVQVFDTVEVRGAEFIPEHDIQMTCGAEPDVPYLEIELRAIEECLMYTGMFEEVRLYPEGETLVIEVKELNTRPGRVEASLSYASQDGIIAGVFLERYNIWPDVYGSARFQFNGEVKRGIGRLYRADLIGTDIDLGVKIGWEELSFDDVSYSEETKQIETYLAWTPGPRTRLEAGIGYRDYRMFNLDAGASPLLLTEEMNGIDAPFIRLGINYSSISEGENGWGDWEYSVGLEQYFWNLGTDDGLSVSRFESRSFLPLGADWRVLVSLTAGTVTGLDDNATRAVDRFFPGAGEFRGFAPRGIGPRDNGDALGGNNFAVGSIEIQRNFRDILKVPLVGGVFWETGAAWGLDDTLGGAIDDSFRQRSSLGLSLAFEIGQAPVSLYLATPIDKQDEDDEQVFGISLSANF